MSRVRRGAGRDRDETGRDGGTSGGTLPPDSVHHRRRLPAVSRRVVHGTRARLLIASVGLIFLALVATVLLIREVLIHDVEERVDAELRQTVQELSRLVQGSDPDTGGAYAADPRALFDKFFASNVPNGDEGQYAFVDGVPYLTNAMPPAELTTDARLVAELRGLMQTRRGSVESSAGRAEYLAVPVRAVDPSTGAAINRGVFLVAEFPKGQYDRLDDTMTNVALGLLAVLALAATAAYATAGRVLAPLRETISTAATIQETNLSSRVPVSGSDDISELARTFNAMLDRVERAVQGQRDFVVDASHELRTPITIVRGHLELMTDDPEDRRETLALVHDELDRMTRLVDDLLLLAKSERADFVQRRTFEVAELMPAVLTKAATLAPRAWTLGPVPPVTLDGDPQRLTQALLQLAENAAQHTPATATITLGAEHTAGTVRLWVRDEGEGIAEHEQARIFERFARASGTRRRSDGSGLGLSIVQAIAHAHEGRVEVLSGVGRGATFTIVLPATTTSARAPAS